MTAEATPDDEAAWEAWDAPTYADAKSPHAAFLAGRVSGRADAAAQALEDAADDRENPYPWPIDTDLSPMVMRMWLRARAAQYREKGTAQ